MKKYDVCNIDNLGRILIPIKLRKEFQLKAGDQLELFVDKDSIILKKYIPSCIFCSSQENVHEIKGRYICEDCIKEISGTSV
ncbi:MAG: AbrB/MazE/SpoVT family DNA-binding domain-containing protein [Clostridia bacterium]|nr:AbrB/MazE/SpoVT family DNA-binding domain-containing protein [Clostridia bacterium]MBQ2152821.1 AbrB/MazE/SpoVT family DNA-binding domain-containing protein [Clostridia bacterium]MBQ2348772.1 AbrB/MazE/SpoVT family DNA-binding domain-containing protein [Clostridia bacterium]